MFSAPDDDAIDDVAGVSPSASDEVSGTVVGDVLDSESPVVRASVANTDAVDDSAGVDCSLATAAVDKSASVEKKNIKIVP